MGTDTLYLWLGTGLVKIVTNKYDTVVTLWRFILEDQNAFSFDSEHCIWGYLDTPSIQRPNARVTINCRYARSISIDHPHSYIHRSFCLPGTSASGETLFCSVYRLQRNCI